MEFQVLLNIEINKIGLFIVLIRQHETLLKRIPAVGEDEERNWSHRVLTSNNSAKSLYGQFEKKMKYFKVYILLEKLVLVTLSVFIFGVLEAMAFTTASIHFTTTVVGLITRPFLSPALDFLFNATSIAMLFSSIIGTLIVFSIRVPSIISSIVVFLVFALPVIGAAIGAYVSYRQGKKAAEKVQNASRRPSVTVPLQTLDQNQGQSDIPVIQFPNEKGTNETENIVLTPRTLASIDRAVDAKTTKTISNFAFLLGFISFLALFGAMIGIIHATATTKTSDPVLGNSFGLDDEEVMLVREFVGYRDWNEFSLNCCCLNGSSSATSSHLSIERWKCKNGYTKVKSLFASNSLGKDSGFEKRW